MYVAIVMAPNDADQSTMCYLNAQGFSATQPGSEPPINAVALAMKTIQTRLGAGPRLSDYTIITSLRCRLVDIPQLSTLPTLRPLPPRYVEPIVTRTWPTNIGRCWTFRGVVTKARKQALLLRLTFVI